MTPEDQQAMDEHVQAIAKILYNDADKSQMKNLAEIEAMVRSQVQAHVTPELGVFLLQALHWVMDTMASGTCMKPSNGFGFCFAAGKTANPMMKPSICSL
jgi:uncharacterized protein (DUF849 family)